METVKVLRWLKQVGDKVGWASRSSNSNRKATMEVESPCGRTLEAVLGAKGEELSVGAVLAELKITENRHLQVTRSRRRGPLRTAPAREANSAATQPRIYLDGGSGHESLLLRFAGSWRKISGTDLNSLAAASPLTRIRGRDVIAALEAADANEKLAAPSSARFNHTLPLCGGRLPSPSPSVEDSSVVRHRPLDQTTAIEQARATLGRNIEPYISA